MNAFNGLIWFIVIILGVEAAKYEAKFSKIAVENHTMVATTYNETSKDYGVIILSIQGETWKEKQVLIEHTSMNPAAAIHNNMIVLVNNEGILSVYSSNDGHWALYSTAQVKRDENLSATLSDKFLLLGSRNGEVVLCYETHTWTLKQVLSISETTGLSHDFKFGCSVAIDGDTALIGAKGLNAVIEYKLSSEGSWTQQSILSPSGKTNLRDLVRQPTSAFNGFGVSVALHNEVALIGTHSHDEVVQVYLKSSDGWRVEYYLQPPTQAPFEFYGHSVAIVEVNSSVNLRKRNSSYWENVMFEFYKNNFSGKVYKFLIAAKYHL